ncbi:methionine--tRNA ligase, cytoplasmic-like [Palaemon carinicauda]|uniref:methionine--tRNA ligase, cytoplasmic-like n=1 Tax=Palaemon carinicauda TaxID=392227 RepID=UPI0035B64235
MKIKTMKLKASKGHPDGLKVLVAAAASGNSVSLIEEKALAAPVILEVTEGNTVAHLHANSAVLYLLQASNLGSNDIEELLQWEATELKPVLLPYLASVGSGREDKTLRSSLQVLLLKLSSGSQLKCEGKNGASVVLFSSLLPLLWEQPSRNLLEEFPSLVSFLNTLQEVDHFKKSVSLWYGNNGYTLKPWAAKLHTPPSISSCTLNLLKGEAASPSKVGATGAPADQEKRLVITAEQILAAKTSWQNPPEGRDHLVKSAPVLPVDGETNILITASLPYVNNVPHLGNIIGCVLSGDCFARFCRLRGDNVLYICGTDEYGTATETKAIAEGLTPQQICDKYFTVHSEVYKWFNIQFDHFGRTTTNLQTKITQDIFWDLERNGVINQDSLEQLHCGKCERFLADRFVEGICPHIGCGYEDARGDQCDGCGKLVNAVELIKPRCKLCSSPPSIKSSTHLFLDLPKIESNYSPWLKATSKNWSNNAKVICDSWCRDGLKSRCITRDLKWGTPVPLDGFKDKVFYVWFDAPIGYISITANYTSEWEKWWKNPSIVKYYEFMAKDNVPFHGVVFPSVLIGTKQKWTMVSNIIATEFLNYEDGKFSKSRGVGVFGDQAIETGIPSDIFRFYLLFVRPESQDTTFSWVDFQTKNNSELLNNLGNFVHRSLSFVFKFFKSTIPEAHPSESDYQVMANINNELEQYMSAMCANRQRDALKCILSITKIGNQYIQENEPYKLIKPDRTDEDKRRGGTVIAVAANIAALVSIILEPYMPDTSKKMKSYLNNPLVLNRLPSAFSCFLPAGHVIQEPSPLITQIDDDTIKKLFEKFRGQSPERKTADPAEVAKMEARVAEQVRKRCRAFNFFLGFNYVSDYFMDVTRYLEFQKFSICGITFVFFQ